MIATERPLLHAPLLIHECADDCAAFYDDTPPDEAHVLSTHKKQVPKYIETHGRRAWRHEVDFDGMSVARNVLKCPSTKPVINRAYYKMKEIMMSCALPLPTTSLHLCEAPGSFVQCLYDELGHDMSASWKWRALSAWDTGIHFAEDKLPLHCGECHYVDLFTSQDHAYGTFDMVTADGAGEMDHDAIEEEHFELLFAQTVTALKSLNNGGTYVVKFFEGLRLPTLLLIAVTTQHFEEVSVIKPRTSRATNSERYLICKGFLQATKFEAVLLQLVAIRERRLTTAAGWITQTRQITSSFAAAQSKALQKSFHNLDALS